MPDIKVSLQFQGRAVSPPQLTPVGSSAGELTSALQVAAQHTNNLLTNFIESGELSAHTGVAVGVDEDEDEDEDSGDDDVEDNLSDILPQPKKKRYQHVCT